MNDKMNAGYFNLYFSLLTGFFVIFFLSFSGFLFGLPVSAAYLVAGAVVSSAVLAVFSLKDGMKPLTVAGLLLIQWAVVCLALSAGFYVLDYSYDGQSYHMSTVFLLDRGWVPVSESAFSFMQENFPDLENDYFLWTDVYVKFVEIFGACLARLTGTPETGKCINLLFAFMTFNYAVYVLPRLLCRLTRGTVWVLAFFLIWNPVAAYQMFTYYVDGVMYYSFVMLLLSVLDMEATAGKKILPFCSAVFSAVILSNVKFLGFIYAGMILGGYFIYLIVLKRKVESKKVFLCGTAIVCLVIVSGINPYFTNVRQGNNLLHPFVGQNKVDPFYLQRPDRFEGKNQLYNLAVSTFAASYNSLTGAQEKIRLKIPFTTPDGETEFTDSDMRAGGFGWYWSGILLISLFLCFGLHFENTQQKRLFLLVMGILLSSVILNPESWWARLVPQLWAVPVFILIFSFNRKELSFRRECALWILLYVMCINNAIIEYHVFSVAQPFRIKNRLYMEALKKNGPAVPRVYVEKDAIGLFFPRLVHFGIDYRIVSREEYERDKKAFFPAFWTLDGKVYIDFKIPPRLDNPPRAGKTHLPAQGI